MSDVTTPDARFLGVNVQPKLEATNTTDENGNPTGGNVKGTGLSIEWQNGPRGQEGTDELAEPNGAFVEDVLWSAHQRLAFFQDSKFASEHNAAAMRHIDLALQSLDARTQERRARNVEGKHEV